MLLAVMDRHGGLFVADQDVFVNIAGGLRVHEPSADLALFLAVASSHMRKPLKKGWVAIGEIGLTGELRRVNRLESRLTEISRLGFKGVIMPKSRQKVDLPKGLEVSIAADVQQAIQLAFDE